MTLSPPAVTDRPGPGVANTAEMCQRVVVEIERALVGKREALQLIMAGLLADGHVLLDDLPGVAKTMTARALATVMGLGFSRVQFTPDVLPTDITGGTVLDLTTNRPVFRPGPVFAQLVLADEINRAPAKTQAALLEAMQERQVTAEGVSHRLARPFLVVATENPIESEGTYPLPEAQLDRFIIRTRIGYPSGADEIELLNRRLSRTTDEVALRPVINAGQFLDMQRSVEGVHVDASLVSYIAHIVHTTRADRELEVGASPRGSLALLKMARARAAMAGRDYATPDDIRAIALPALAHRVVLTSEAWARRVSSEDVVRRVVDQVPTPTWR